MKTVCQHLVRLFVTWALASAVASAAGTGTEVAATFTSATTVPVTAAGYTAAGSTVSFTLNFAPATGTNLTVVNNTGLGWIDGTFDNLAQGQMVTLTYGGIGYPFIANYFGGTGNDLVLQWANTRLMSWGWNNSGRLGTGSSAIQSNVPVPVDTSGVLADKGVMAMALGATHSLVVCWDGTLASWGYNNYGQLGNNSTVAANVPTPMVQTGVLAGKTVVALAGGGNDGLALCTDGTLAAWGYNYYGQLGNNSTTNSSVPVLVVRTGAMAGKQVVAIAAGSFHNLALCADGTLVGWGNNEEGQLGNGTTTNSKVPVVIPITGALAGKSLVAIAAGSDYSLALGADGTLATWGNNYYGQLGNNSTTNSNVPVAVVTAGVLAGKTVTAISAGSSHGLVLCADGTLAAWGNNTYGQLGNTSNTSSTVPVLVTKAGVLAAKTPVTVCARSGGSFALCADGTVAAWGFGTDGQLGNGGTIASNVPVLVTTSGLRAGERFMSLAAGRADCSLVLTASSPPPLATTLAAGDVTDLGAVLNGSVSANGNATTVSFEYGLTPAYGTTVTAAPASLGGTASAAVSATLTDLLPGTTYHYRVVASSANGVAKGTDQSFTATSFASLAGLTSDSGRLMPGFGPTISRYEVTVPNSTGNLRVCPVAADPGATVTVNGMAAAAGAAVTVELADGVNPVSIVVTAADGIITHTYMVQVTRWPASYVYQSATGVPVTMGGCAASGSTATLALGFAPPVGTALTVLKNTGTEIIRGSFDNLAQGQVVKLAYNNATYKFVANYYGGSGNDLVLQWAYTKLYAWGDNSYGAYGSGNNSGSPVPVAVGPAGILAGKTVTAVALGASHTLALCADGTLAAWGANGSGQLGNGSSSSISSYLPVAVTTTGVLAGKRVIAIAAGGDHCLVLCADGTLAAWGANSDGVLGSGSANSSSVPVAVSTSGVLAGKTVVAIATGQSHSRALCSDGTLAAWGYNGSGHLGDGTTTNRNVPVAVIRTGVLAGKTVTAIAAGASSLALCSDGTIASWGGGWSGLLGNGTTVNSSVPVAVTATGVLAGKTVTAIASGYNSNLALCADRTLVAWGYNGSGGLGNGTNTDSSVPVIVTGSGVLAGKTPIAIAVSYPCFALCADGTLAAWGYNTSPSRLGNGTSTASNVPVAASLASLGSGEKLIALAPGSDAQHTMAVAAVPLSGNCDLASLGLGSAVLDPVFAPATTAYSVRVMHGTAAVTVTPAVAEANATVTVNDVPLATGATSPAIPLVSATNVVTIKVTAENGTMKSYVITVVEDSTLAALSLDSGSLLPGFSPFVRNYTACVATATATLVVTPVAADPAAAITVNGTAVASGSASAPLDLALGYNAITVTVTALDGTATSYQLAVLRPDPIVYTFRNAAGVALTVPAYVATGNTADFALRFAPPVGTNLTVINNTGNEMIVGRFANLAQGQVVDIKNGAVTYRLVANYYGGTGNDLVLQWANTKVYAWGWNNTGQLGNGSKANGTVPAAITASGVLASKTITAMAAGAAHSLALCSDGTLAAWGSNSSGQLGNGTTTDSSVPVAVATGGLLAGKTVVAIAAGDSHSVVLCDDGTLAAWGANAKGQLGNGFIYPSTVPVAVNCAGILAGRTITAIAVGHSHSLALCADGTIAGWGSNISGQLGIGTTADAIAPAAVVTTGALVGKTVTTIAAGSAHSLARCADGSLVAWGDNSYGQLGTGNTASSTVPVAVPASGALAGKAVAAVAAGYSHCLALCTDGSLAAWGANSYGNLGNNSSTNSSVPVAVTATSILSGKVVSRIAAGYLHSLAWCTDGTIAAWGFNSNGALGNGTTTSSAVPVATSAPATGEKFTALATGCYAGHTLAVAALPVSTNATLAALTLNPGSLDAPFAAGTTSYTGRVPHGTPSVTVTATATDNNSTLTINGVAAVSGTASPAIPLSPGNMTLTIKVTAQNGVATTTYVVTLKDDSSLASLTLDTGTLVPGFVSTTTAYTTYVPTATTAMVVTPTATEASAAITVNGTPVTSGSPSNPVALAPGSNAITVRVTALDGTVTNYVLTVIRQVPVNFIYNSATGIAVTAAGYTASGNTANLTLNFAPVAGTNLTVVNNTGAAPIRGAFDNLAPWQRVELTYGGITYTFVANYTGGTGNDLVLQWANTRLFAWGNNGYGGQLGNNSTTDSLVAVPVIASGVLAGKTVVATASGAYHNLALCADGTMAAWGNNDYGQLGINSSGSKAVPTAVMQAGVLAGKRVSVIAASNTRSVALCDDGTIAAWGQGYYGQLGNGGTSQQTAPVLVDRTGVLTGKTATAIAAGGSHNLALCSDGTLVAWGRNNAGQLGDGSTLDGTVPGLVNRTGVLAGKTVTAIAAGGSHSFALCSDGTLAAWGNNDYGQLGDNTSTSRSLPVAVFRTGVLSGKTITGMACGEAFSLVVCTDGTLVAWGNNNSGQLGIGTTNSSLLPVLVNRTGVLAGKTVVAVAAGSSHSLARCSDGNLATWGYNSNGQLGNGTNTTSTVPVLVSKSPLATGENFMAAVIGTYHSTALVASPPPPMATTLAATGVLDTAATLQGSVNAQGGTVSVTFQFGLTSAYGTTLTATPASVTGATATTVGATVSGLLAGTTYHYRVVATSAGRTVTGADQTFTTTTLATLASLVPDSGTLTPAFAGITTNYFATVPFATASLTLTPTADNPAAIIQVNGVTVASGAASGPLALAVGNNPVNTVVTAGSNTQTYNLIITRLPETFAFASATSVPVTAANFAAIGAAPGFAVNFAPTPGAILTVVKNTGRNLIQGTFANLAQWQAVNLTYNGLAYAFVANYRGGTGNDLVLQWANTRLLAWGAGYGQVPLSLGDLLAGKSAAMISPGAGQHLILCTDGSVAILNGSDTTPTWVTGTGALAGKTVVSVAAGGTTHLALCSDGTVVSWSATGGAPVAVDQSGVLAGKTVIALAGGGGHSLALCSDGTLAAWGTNNNGQLGIGNITSSTVPVLVDQTGVLAGKTVTAIGGGGYFSAALCADGSIATWGSGPTGQLGSGTPNPAQSTVPVLVSQAGALSGKVVAAIAVGYQHTLARCGDGTVVAWGTSSYGELGNGSTSSSNVPVPITQTGVLAGKSVIAITAGAPSSNPSYGQSSFALCADGTLAAWGYNRYGQLGNNNMTTSNVPVLVDLSALKAGERILTVVGNGTWQSLAMVASAPPPVATTLAATAIADAGATLNGSVNANGGTATVAFEYGLTESYGTTVAAIPATATGTAETAVNATLSGLIPGATYHFRVVATTGNGTIKGADQAFSTTTLATLADLTLSQGVVSPAFAGATPAYFATVPTTTTSVTLTPVVTTPGATVTVAGVSVDSGSASGPLDLAIGGNRIDVVVTAEGGGTSRTYSVTVTRLPETFVFNSAADVPLTADEFVAAGAAGDFVLTFAPTPGTNLTVVQNTGKNAIQGTFSNLAQGQVVSLSYGGVSYAFAANYLGGTGNDLVLQWANMRVLGWGANGGSLGNGGTANSSVAVPVTMTGALAGKTVLAVSVGASHSLALCVDGTLAAWGSNNYGQLGNNSTTASDVPVLVTLTGVLAGKTVTAIATGGGLSLALCSDGTLASWGYNSYGQLGNNSTTNSSVPVLVDQTGVLTGKSVVAISVGDDHCLTLCSDGSVAAWGNNLYGNVGNNSTTARLKTPVWVSRTGVLADKTVVAISAGPQHSLALCSDGTLVTWGHNSSGQLGNSGAGTNSIVPVLVDQTGILAGKAVTAIAAGGYHCLALCADGSIAAWGSNSYGQLGHSIYSQSSVPVWVDQTGVLTGKTVRSIAGGTNHSLALCVDGTLATWGQNHSGQLGNNTTTSSAVPVLVSPNGLGADERFVAAEAGTANSFALAASPPPPLAATLAATGILDSTATVNGNVNAQGSTVAVSFEYGLTTSYGATATAAPATGTTTTAVSATISGLLSGNTYHYRVVAANGGATVKGDDFTFTTTTLGTLASLNLSSGTLDPPFAGTIANYLASVPATATTIAITPVVASPDATVTINGVQVESGTASGPLALTAVETRIDIAVTAADGLNTRTYTLTVTRLPQTFIYNSAADVPLTVGNFTATGNTASFALNYAPVPGTSLTVVRNTGTNPIRGAFTNLAQGQTVDLTYGGGTYSFVANYFGGTGNDLVLQWAKNRLLAWGYNSYGQLGNGTTTNSSSAVPVDLTGALAGKPLLALAAGSFHNLALCADGTVAAWGYNTNGQLGNNSTATSKVPIWVNQTGVLAGKTVVAIAAGSSHSLALCADGTLAAWGYNSRGQLGNGGTAQSSVPVAVNQTGVLAGRTVVAIAAGGAHSLALCADGTLMAWGYNGDGALGNNSIIDSSVPVLVDQTGVLAGKTIQAISTKNNHNLVLCADGTMAAWGANPYGQLGNNSATNGTAPVLVIQTGVLAGKMVVAVAAGANHNLALCSDGTMAAWGYISNSAVPVLVDQTGALYGKTITAITAANEYSLALCADATLAAWGNNNYGQLGNNSTNNSSVPTWVNLSMLKTGERCVTAVAGYFHTMALIASPPPPMATTLATTQVADLEATLNASVNAQGSTTTVSFEYGLTAAYGVTLAATPASLTGTTGTAVSATLGGLLAGTTYHYRVVATSAGGTVNGADLTFTTTNIAALASLELSGGLLTPAFSGINPSYIATVPNAATTINVTATAALATSTVEINGVTVESGTPSGPLDLLPGNNVIAIQVTAADGVTMKTYTVTVTRLPATFTFNSPTDVPLTVGGFAATGDSASLVLNHAPPPGTRLTIVRNTGNNLIQGTFGNLRQGQRVALTYGGITYSFAANYYGGTGNDLVLEWANTRLMSWGYNNYGQLGNNSTTPSPAPVPMVTGDVLAGKVPIAFASGGSHNYALCADGTLAAWGYNEYGQLGNGGTNNCSVPVAVNQTGALGGKLVVAVAAGDSHGLALCADGGLATWGANDTGQLGNGGAAASSVPGWVNQAGVLAGKTVSAIAAGSAHNLVLCADGTLAAWGYNYYGQLGNNSTIHASVPVVIDRTGVLAGKTVVAVAAGAYHNLALCADGTLAAWGYNNYGALGNNSTTNSSVPVLVNQTGILAGKTITAISAGGYHNLALCSDGTIAAWGYSSAGQLGNLSTTTSIVPLRVNQTGMLAGKTVVGVAAGNAHSLALCSDGSATAWGDNTNGQLGNGITTSSSVPVLVVNTSLQPGERFIAASCGDSHVVTLVASPPPPLVITLAATEVATTTAILNGSVNANGSDTAVSFEYGPTTAYGTTVAAVPATLTGTSTTSVRAALSGLAPDATYHFRVNATGAGGTVTGEDMTFATAPNLPPTFAGFATSTPFQNATVVSLRKLLTKATDPDSDALAVTAAGPASAQGGSAVLQATGILYTPPTGFTGTDTFQATITDGLGASVVGTVTVTVGPAPNAGGVGVNPPVLTSQQDGKMVIAFHGIPGRRYIVQRSIGGLDNWVTLATVTADASGKVAFTDDSPPAGSAFYRLGLR
jgi:alpha-tubulin suppressor-like RCC1 family protein/phosphodiesterase/alkaline phosphatase D-like protein